jgi:hypothetical protein
MYHLELTCNKQMPGNKRNFGSTQNGKCNSYVNAHTQESKTLGPLNFIHSINISLCVKRELQEVCTIFYTHQRAQVRLVRISNTETFEPAFQNIAQCDFGLVRQLHSG